MDILLIEQKMVKEELKRLSRTERIQNAAKQYRWLINEAFGRKVSLDTLKHDLERWKQDDNFMDLLGEGDLKFLIYCKDNLVRKDPQHPILYFMRGLENEYERIHGKIQGPEAPAEFKKYFDYFCDFAINYRYIGDDSRHTINILDSNLASQVYTEENDKDREGNPIYYSPCPQNLKTLFLKRNQRLITYMAYIEMTVQDWQKRKIESLIPGSQYNAVERRILNNNLIATPRDDLTRYRNKFGRMKSLCFDILTDRKYTGFFVKEINKLMTDMIRVYDHLGIKNIDGGDLSDSDVSAKGGPIEAFRRITIRLYAVMLHYLVSINGHYFDIAEEIRRRKGGHDKNFAGNIMADLQMWVVRAVIGTLYPHKKVKLYTMDMDFDAVVAVIEKKIDDENAFPTFSWMDEVREDILMKALDLLWMQREKDLIYRDSRLMASKCKELLAA